MPFQSSRNTCSIFTACALCTCGRATRITREHFEHPRHCLDAPIPTGWQGPDERVPKELIRPFRCFTSMVHRLSCPSLHLRINCDFSVLWMQLVPHVWEDPAIRSLVYLCCPSVRPSNLGRRTRSISCTFSMPPLVPAPACSHSSSHGLPVRVRRDLLHGCMDSWQSFVSTSVRGAVSLVPLMI